jgi:hypothetical protein
MAKNFPWNVEERSDFWGYGATAAVAGGVGYGLYRANPAVRAAMSVGTRDVAHDVAAELRTMGRFNVARRGARSAIDDIGENILTNLAASSSPGTVKADIAQATYEAALRGGRSTHTEAYSVYQKIMHQTTVRNAYEQAKAAIGELQGDVSLLTSRISDLGEGGFYGRFMGQEGGRLTEIAKAATATGEFVGSRVAREEAAWMSGAVADRAKAIQARLDAAASQAGGKIQWTGIQDVEDILEGQRVTTPMLRGRVGGEAINIPLKATGMTYGGDQLTARYVTRGAFGTTGDIRDYTTEYVSRLEEMMGAQKTKTSLKNAVIDANHEIVNAMRNRDAAHRSMAIWKMPEAMLPAGGRVKSRMNQMEAVFVGQMTEGYRSKVIAESLAGGRQLYPIGSPETVAKGTFVRGDIAEQLFGPMGRLMGVEQRPTQFIREKFGVTAEAKAAARGFRGEFGRHFSRLERKIQGTEYQGLLYGGYAPTAAQAYTAPQLTAFYAKPSRLETGPLAQQMFAEEAIISRRVAPMMEYERTVQKKIALNEGFRVNKQVLDALKARKVGELAELGEVGRGGFLGVEFGTGKELWVEGAGGARADIIGAQLTGENQATVFLKERHRLSDEKWWKFFSEDVKFLGKQADDVRMRRLAEAAGIGTQVAGQDLEAIVSGKLVGRNRMALMTQQIEALSMITAGKMEDRALSLRRQVLAKEFMTDPAHYLKIDRLMGDHMADAEYRIQKNMVALAKKFKFSPEEMGLTFGLMDAKRAAELGIAAEVEAAPGVVGLFKGRLGDLAFEGGAGGLGKFEQTGFRLLAMKGEEGQRFAAELATRIRGKDELIPANRMMASVLNEMELTERLSKIAGKAPIDERTLAQMTAGDLLREEGRYVTIGRKIQAFGGAKQIYIPGIKEAQGMMLPTITDKGQRIPSDISRGLEDLRGLVAKGAAQEEIEDVAARLRTSIVQQTELQASATGKILGTRYLTGIRQTAAQTAQSNAAFRISPRTANRMFEDLIDRAQGTEQKAFLNMQKRKLLDEGEQLIGGVWRHPTTGPESFQFVRYQVDRNLADELIAAPYQMGEIVLGGKRHKVDVSAMVGMKGDFDKDMFNIAAISDRDTVKRLTAKMKNEVAEGYTGYLFNHYAMKDLIDQRKGPISDLVNLTRQEALEQGARNLTTAKVATPQVNLALQKLKLGLQYAAPKEYRPMAELFWHLEEVAIGGKHGAQQSRMYQDIAHAVRQRDASTLESVIKTLMGEKDKVISGQITGPTGDLVPQTMKYSPKRWADQAMQAAVSASEDVEIAYKSARAAKGIVPQDMSTLVEMYYKRRTGSLDVAQSVMHSKSYGMPGFTERANRVLRQAGTKTRAILGALSKAKAPALVGAAIGAGMMLSAPSVSGALQAPREGPAGGRNINNIDLGPPAGVGVNPPPPRIMVSPKAYDMGGIKMSSRANIRMSMPDAQQSGGDFMRNARTLASGGNVRVRTTDDREALSPHRLANKIHERL